MQTCDECGFSYDLAAAWDAAQAITSGAAEIAALLKGDQDVRTRREPEVWSPLEYGCHVRDVLLVQRERVLAAQWTELLDCAPMGRDERVALDGYAEQNPIDVARQLVDAALLISNDLERLDDDTWDRRVIYNYPERSEVTLRWVALNTVHEVRHHGMDVRRQL